MRSIYYEMPYQVTMVKGLREPFKFIMRAIASGKKLSLWGKIRLAVALIQLLKNVQSLPEPTIKNVAQPNARTLCEIRDYFFAHSRLPFIDKELRAFVNFVIIIYDTDFYRPFMDVWVQEIKKRDWKVLKTLDGQPLPPDPHFWQS